MKKMTITLAALCVVTIGSLPLSAASLEQGRKEFKTYCAPCHGSTGVGDGPVAAELMKKPIDLTVFSKNAGGTFPKDKVKKLVDGRTMPRAHGTPEMPVWGQWFSYQATDGGLLQEERKAIERKVNDRLNSLILYIKSLQK